MRSVCAPCSRPGASWAGSALSRGTKLDTPQIVLENRAISNFASAQPRPPRISQLNLTDDFQLGHLGRLDVLDADLSGELFDDTQEIWPRGGSREEGLVHFSIVASLSEVNVQRHLAEKGDAQLGRLAPSAAATEDINPFVAGGVEEALGVDQLMRLGTASVSQISDHVEEGHVLDHAQDRDLQLAEHVDRAGRVEQGDLLRRANHDGAGQRE